MTAYIFLGPTLSVAEARAHLDAVYLPPAAQGDVYRVARAGARVIGIIDGYFERLPSVWHKEILWAMSEGVHMFGSASMGALRAAELAQFGMIGVGATFDALQSGELEDDDEVTVAHAPADAGYRASSEAMVDIRATLARATAEGVIKARTRQRLEEVAKALFYPERAWPIVLRGGLNAGLPPSELNALESWLPGGRVSQKQLDAIAMLDHIRQFLAAGPPRNSVRYTLEWTVMWEKAIAEASELHLDGNAASESVLPVALLEEAQLTGAYEQLREGALLRELAIGYARRAGVRLSREYQQEVADDYRRSQDLLGSKDVDRWLEDNHLTRDQFAQLLADEALVRWTASQLKGEATLRLAEELRMRNRYTELLERARHKQRILQEYGWHNPSLDELGVSQDELLAWYFERLGRPVPADLEHAARQAGFEDSGVMLRALVRELCYLRYQGREAQA